MSKVKRQVIKLKCEIDPLDTVVTARDLVEALEKAGAESVELTGNTMRVVVKPEIGGES